MDTAMTGPRQEFFTPIGFDFLWEAMEIGELPYPLRVPSHGATQDERAALRVRTHNELKARGIRDHHGRLEPHVENWLHLLARPSISVDALHIPDFQAPPIAVLAASDGREGVLAVQDSDGIWIRPVFAEGLASAVIDLLPPGTRGTESSITLPLDQALRTPPARQPSRPGPKAPQSPLSPLSPLSSQAPQAGEVAPDEGEESGRARRRALRMEKAAEKAMEKAERAEQAEKARSRTALSERVSDPQQAYAELAGQPRLRGGQLAANSMNNLGARRRSPVLGWFDTATGRYLSLSRAGTDGREWVTVSPADAKTLRSRMSELVTGVAQN